MRKTGCAECFLGRVWQVSHNRGVRLCVLGVSVYGSTSGRLLQYKARSTAVLRAYTRRQLAVSVLLAARLVAVCRLVSGENGVKSTEESGENEKRIGSVSQRFQSLLF